MSPEEKQKDIDSRAADFKKEYVELSKKYQMDWGCYPQFVSGKEGYLTKTVMVVYDTKYPAQSENVPKEGVVSPIQPENV